MSFRLINITVFCILLIHSLLLAQTDSMRFTNHYSLSDTVKAQEFFNMGKTYFDKAKYDSATINFAEAGNIYALLLNIELSENLLEKWIATQNELAFSLIKQDKSDKAFSILEGIKESNMKNAIKENLVSAKTYYVYGVYYLEKTDWDRSIEMFNKAINIRKEILGELNLDVADNYNSLGIAYSKKSLIDKATEYFKKSLEIKIELFGDQHPQVATSYNNLGINIYETGDYLEALNYYEKALSIRLKNYGEDNLFTGTSYNNLGNVFYSIGNYEKALENHQKSLKIRSKILGEEHSVVSTCYNNIGLVYWKMKKYEEAIDNHKKALSIRKKVFGDKHPLVAMCLMNIGVVLADYEKFDDALSIYNEALDCWGERALEKSIELSKIYQNIAEMYWMKNEFDSALVAIQKSIITTVLDFDDKDIETDPEINFSIANIQLLNSLKIKAKSYLSLGLDSLSKKEVRLKYLFRALEVFNLADKLIDKMNIGFKSDDSKLYLGNNSALIFEKAIKTALSIFELNGEEIYKEKAFYFIEKNKSALLRQGMLESKAKIFAKISQAELEREKKIKADLYACDADLQSEMMRTGVIDSTKYFYLQNKLFELQTKYKNLLDDFEKKYPDYFKLKYKSGVKSVKEIQNLLNSDEVVIEYQVGKKSLYGAIVSKNIFQIKEIKIPDDFDALVLNFYSSIQKAEMKTFIDNSNKLSEILIEPFYGEIFQGKKIIIIPHDILFKIPFETLFTKVQKSSTRDFTKLNYLIKDFDIAYHYSASLFFDSKEEADNKTSKNFIGFAPVFPKDNLLGYTISTVSATMLASNDNILRSVSIDGTNYDELKYSEWEVNSIIDLFGKNNASSTNTAYFYADAKEDSFKTNVNDYKIVHIASHSFMNEDEPNNSGVIFAQPNDSVFSNDGILYSGETYNLDLSANLVVLSSCESGLGKLFRGEGMMALNRGFLYSGASNIVFSLWKIPDKHTSELMVEFYKQMISGNSYSESLRQAKLKLISKEITARPRSWAGFLLIGSD